MGKLDRTGLSISHPSSFPSCGGIGMWSVERAILNRGGVGKERVKQPLPLPLLHSKWPSPIAVLPALKNTRPDDDSHDSCAMSRLDLSNTLLWQGGLGSIHLEIHQSPSNKRQSCHPALPDIFKGLHLRGFQSRQFIPLSAIALKVFSLHDSQGEHSESISPSPGQLFSIWRIYIYNPEPLRFTHLRLCLFVCCFISFCLSACRGRWGQACVQQKASFNCKLAFPVSTSAGKKYAIKIV